MLLATPLVCPDVQSIQKAGLDYTEFHNDTWVVAKKKQAYNTNDVWSFSILDVIASDEHDALEKAKKALATLSNPKGPILIKELNKWTCAYTIQEYKAIAITPPIVDTVPVPPKK
jgi:hypothetical protein